MNYEVWNSFFQPAKKPNSLEQEASRAKFKLRQLYVVWVATCRVNYKGVANKAISIREENQQPYSLSQIFRNSVPRLERQYCGFCPNKCYQRSKTNKSNCKSWKKSTFDWRREPPIDFYLANTAVGGSLCFWELKATNYWIETRELPEQRHLPPPPELWA